MVNQPIVPHREGLRFLLPALPWGPDRGPMIVVRGRAGSGKTVFLADLVLGTLWRHGFHVAVFDAEQGKEQAVRLLHNFGYLRDVTIAAGASPLDPVIGERFYYRDVSSLDWQDLCDAVERQTGEWTRQRVPRGQGVVVIDSLNALVSSPVDRGDIRELRAGIQTEGWWLATACEADPGEDPSYGFLDYEADILFWLTVERPGPRGYSRRMLEIVKCRNTEHVRGKHHFAIGPIPEATGGPRGEGDQEGAVVQVRVLPSLTAKLSKWGKQPGRGYGKGREKAGIAGLTDMLGGGASEGSVTVYVGPPGSRKGPSALHFALDDQPEGGECKLKQGRTLIVSLASGEAQVAALAAQYQPLCDFLLRRDRARFHEDECIAFRRVPPGPISASACLAMIEAWLGELQPARVIVTDLSEIEEQLPIVAKERRMFVTALVQLFRSWPKHLTSLLVETLAPAAQSQTRPLLWSDVGGLADNVVEFRHLFFYGSMHLGVSATWRHGAAGESGFRELRTHRAEDRDAGQHTLEVMDNLRGFTDLFTSEPKRAPINVYVYEDSDLQRAFNKRLEEMLAQAFPGAPESQCKVHPFTASEAGYTFRALERATDTPQPDIRIATIDEFWVKRLAKPLKPTDPPKLAPCPEKLYRKIEGRWIQSDPAYVPHYLNVGLIAAFDVSAATLHRSPDRLHDRLGKDWSEFKDIAAAELQALRKGGSKPQYAFDFGKHAVESWSCTLLEVLSTAGAFMIAPDDAGDPKVTRFRIADPRAIEELSAFCELFWLGRGESRPTELASLQRQYLAAISPTEQRTAETKDEAADRGEEGLEPRKPSPPRPLVSAAPAVFCRLWYTELADWLRAVPMLAERTTILQLPGKDGSGRSMQGEWYWCVLAGGVSAHTGWDIIEWLTSEWMGARQHVAGVGLPAHRSFYGGADADQTFLAADGRRTLGWVSENLWESGLSRVDIDEYPSISPLLADLLYRILCAGGRLADKPDELRKEVAGLARQAERQIRAISPTALRDG